MVGHDQRDGRHHEQHAEIQIGAGDLKILLAVTQPADEDADADQSVADDHYHREHGIARQRWNFLLAEHDGGDQRDLDDGDRQRQQQRAIGFADSFGDHFRMMHGREHRAEQDDQEDNRENQPGGRRRKRKAQRGGAGEQQNRKGRKNPRRSRHRTVRAHTVIPKNPKNLRNRDAFRP